MFPHIIGNPKLVRNSENTWKHHKTRLAETDTKLAALLSKLYAQMKVDWAPISHELNVLRPPLDASNDPQVQL